MKQHLLNSLILLFALIAGTATSWAEDEIIWSENFTSLDANATPTSPTNASYTGVTYTCTNGQGKSPGSTKVMNENLAGGASAPELMVGKKGSGTGAAGGSFTVVVPLNNYEGTFTLTYCQNKQSLKVYSTTTGVEGGQTLKPDAAGSQTTTFTGITKDMTSITIIFEATTTNNVRLDDITLKGSKASSIATPTFSVDGGTYTTDQSVELACTTDGATIRYTLDGTEPTESSTAYSSAIAVSTTTTIKAKAFKGGEASGVATATYTILPVIHAGTAADPYTVADARNAIDANIGLEKVYVSGIVCEGGSSLSSGAMNYWISDDGLETDKFYIYKGKGLSGADFSATSDVQVGDVVVVYGIITKYKSTYEFDEGSQLYSLDRPVVPTILTTPATISELEYVTGNGPSDAQTFTVSGSNLTADITLALSGTDFEMSLSEGSGYTNSLTLTQTAGAVDETTVYVRLKEGLEINDYVGTITLTSADATDRTIDLTGCVTPTLFTWDLSKKTYTTETELVTWSSSYATMQNATTGGTAATNYLGGDANNRTSSRFYAKNTLTITPASGYMITSIEFTATSENYASTLKSSTWTNATAASSGTTVTVTPTDGVSAISATIGGTCGFTAVTVYYQAVATINLAAACTDGEGNYYGTYSNSKAFIVPEDLTVSTISVSAGKMTLSNYDAGEIVKANTGVLISATSAGDKTVTLASGGTELAGNMLKASGDAGIDAAAMGAAADCKFYRLTMHGGTQIGFFWGNENGAAFAVAANKAYLAVPDAEAVGVKGFRFGENTDAIIEIMSNGENEKTSAIYDLSGRRVVKPTKGLYIVNGKKVVK